jgi:hypothetical protein
MGNEAAMSESGWPTPDWAHWKGVPIATLRECVSLSCALDPRMVTEGFWESVGKYGALAAQKVQQGQNMPSDTVIALLWERMPIAAAAASVEGPLRPDPTVTCDDIAKVRLRVAEFMNWAATMGWVMPAEFIDASLPISQRRAPAGHEWKDLARNLATAFCKPDPRRGWTRSKEDVAKHVEQEFEKDGVLGAHGKKLTAANILRNALKDWAVPK